MKLTATFLCVFCAVLWGCGNQPDPDLVNPGGLESAWPPGTVFAVNEIPILASEVDELCPAVKSLYPEYALPHLRRLVLTNHLLNRAAVRSRDHKEWLQAKQAVEAEWDHLQAGEQPSVAALVRSGRHVEMGFGVWAHANQSNVGDWSGPFDLMGRWVILRLDGINPFNQGLSVSVLEFSYIDPTFKYGKTKHASMQAAHHAAKLQIVDPAWAEFVPMEWQFEMRGK